MIYDLVTSFQLCLVVVSAALIVKLFSTRQTCDYILATFVAFLLLDQAWWSLAREAFSDKAWIGVLYETVGIESKIWFEKSSYVAVFKFGMMASLGAYFWKRVHTDCRECSPAAIKILLTLFALVVLIGVFLER